MTIADLKEVAAQATIVRVTNFEGDSFFYGEIRCLPEQFLGCEVEFVGVYEDTLEIGIN